MAILLNLVKCLLMLQKQVIRLICGVFQARFFFCCYYSSQLLTHMGRLLKGYSIVFISWQYHIPFSIKSLKKYY